MTMKQSQFQEQQIGQLSEVPSYRVSHYVKLVFVM